MTIEAEYEPTLLVAPWVVFDGPTDEITYYHSREEAEKQASALLADSHDGETWLVGADQTFVALMVCQATEIPLTDDDVIYRLRPIEKLAPGPMADQLLAKVAQFLEAMPDTAHDAMADSPLALGCMRALEEWINK